MKKIVRSLLMCLIVLNFDFVFSRNVNFGNFQNLVFAQEQQATESISAPSSEFSETNGKVDENGKRVIDDKSAHLLVSGLMGGLVAGRLVSWGLNKKVRTNYYLINEGWFQKWTYAGGADKLGHFYTDYVLVRMIYYIYLKSDYSREQAIKLAFWEGAIFRTLLEISDGYTAFGASLGDILFNVMGAAFSSFLLSNPSLDEILAFSWSYVPSLDVHDGYHSGKEFSIDYSGMVFSLDYLPHRWSSSVSNETLSKFLEFGTVGLNYRTRFYKSPFKEKRQRLVGMSLGLNLSAYLDKDRVMARDFLKMIRLPLTYSGFSYNLETKKLGVDFGLNYFY